MIYQITNLLNDKIYVGAHKTSNLDDSYMGSGKILQQAYKKYGKENFKKTVLFLTDTPKAMYELESTLVNENFIKRQDTYNISKGGNGSWSHMSAGQLFAAGKKGGQVCKDNKLGFMANNFEKQATFKNKNHTEESIRKISESKKGTNTGAANASFGTMWITDGVVNKKIKKTKSIPIGFREGRVGSGTFSTGKDNPNWKEHTR
jgi:group I intron endonuclease